MQCSKYSSRIGKVLKSKKFNINAKIGYFGRMEYFKAKLSRLLAFKRLRSACFPGGGATGMFSTIQHGVLVEELCS